MAADRAGSPGIEGCALVANMAVTGDNMLLPRRHSMAFTHGAALEDLGARIVGGDLPTGASLTLNGLELHYEASRTLVREVVRVLESKGLVESKRRVGITVLPEERWSCLDPQVIQWALESARRNRQITNLTELRAGIEPMAGRIAAIRASEEDREELIRLARVLQEEGEHGGGATVRYLDADLRFHELILRASGNPLYAQLAAPVSSAIEGRHVAGLLPDVPVEPTLAHHVGAAEAIRDHRPEDAEEHIRAYLQTILLEVQALD